MSLERCVKCDRCGTRKFTPYGDNLRTETSEWRTLITPTRAGNAFDASDASDDWATAGQHLCPDCAKAFDTFLQQGAKQERQTTKARP